MSDDLHQLHIDIPKELYDNLKEILPERGMLTGLIRRFLQRYATAFKEAKPMSPSPIDIAAESLVDEELRRR